MHLHTTTCHRVHTCRPGSLEQQQLEPQQHVIPAAPHPQRTSAIRSASRCFTSASSLAASAPSRSTSRVYQYTSLPFCHLRGKARWVQSTQQVGATRAVTQTKRSACTQPHQAAARRSGQRIFVPCKPARQPKAPWHLAPGPQHEQRRLRRTCR